MTLGLELTDDFVRAAVVDDHGHVRVRDEQAPAAGGPVRAARDLVSRLGGDAMPIGLASHPADDGAHAAVAAALGARLAASVGVGDAAVLAETWSGAASGARTAAVLTLGDHILGGLLIDGRPWTGAHGLAGSVGWLALNPVEREDYRRYGGLEAEVGAAGLVRRLVWRVKSGDRSTVVDQVGGDLARLTAEHVLHGARVGDGVCISVVRDTARYVGMAVSNIAAIIDPEVVVLGGRLATSGDIMLEAIRHECQRRLAAQQAERLRVVLSPFGEDGVAVGAARAARLARA